MDPDNLTSINLFSSLTDEEARDFNSRCERRSYKPGEVIFHEDDEGDELFIVEEGTVTVTKSLSIDAEHTLAVLQPGAILGEMAVLGSHVRSAAARARDHVKLLVMRGDHFKQLVAESPASGMKFLQALVLTLIHRLTLTNDLLRDALAWGLEVSGASSLNFHRLMSDRADVKLSLINGSTVHGRLIQVERDQSGGLELFVYDAEEHVHIVPYHAIVDIVFNFALYSDPEESSKEMPADDGDDKL